MNILTRLKAHYYSLVNQVYREHGGILEFHRAYDRGDIKKYEFVYDGVGRSPASDFISPTWMKIAKENPLEHI